MIMLEREGKLTRRAVLGTAGVVGVVARRGIAKPQAGSVEQGLGDPRLKSEGYAIVRVDKVKREFVLECWPWDVDPAADRAKQFEGWPYTLSFDKMKSA
jgi:hypothetical protein